MGCSSRSIQFGFLIHMHLLKSIGVFAHLLPTATIRVVQKHCERCPINWFFLLNREANRKVWFTVDLPFAINIRNMGRTLRIIGHWMSMSSPTLIGNNCIWVDGIIHELMESTCTWIILMTLVRWFDGNIRFCTNNLDDECASHFGNISWEFICKMVIIWC